LNAENGYLVNISADFLRMNNQNIAKERQDLKKDFETKCRNILSQKSLENRNRPTTIERAYWALKDDQLTLEFDVKTKDLKSNAACDNHNLKMANNVFGDFQTDQAKANYHW